jgi:hypothetical protein
MNHNIISCHKQAPSIGNMQQCNLLPKMSWLHTFEAHALWCMVCGTSVERGCCQLSKTQKMMAGRSKVNRGTLFAVRQAPRGAAPVSFWVLGLWTAEMPDSSRAWTVSSHSCSACSSNEGLSANLGRGAFLQILVAANLLRLWGSGAFMQADTLQCRL